MNTTSFTFPADHETKVFLNGNGGISITQDDYSNESSIVVIGSKKRAIEIVKAVRSLAMIARWEADDYDQTESTQQA